MIVKIKQQSFGTTTRGETVTLYEMNTPELIVGLWGDDTGNNGERWKKF